MEVDCIMEESLRKLVLTFTKSIKQSILLAVTYQLDVRRPMGMMGIHHINVAMASNFEAR